MPELRVLQSTALYKALTTNVEFMSLVPGGIYDTSRPEDSDFPCIVLGNASDMIKTSFNVDRYTHTIAIHIFSRRMGKKEVLTIFEAMKAILHRVRLPLEGSNGEAQISAKLRLVDTLLEPDRITVHGLVFYECLLDG